MDFTSRLALTDYCCKGLKLFVYTKTSKSLLVRYKLEINQSVFRPNSANFGPVGPPNLVTQ
jgi:hypothetical protein